MLSVQAPISKPYSDIRIKVEEENASRISPPAPDWIATAGEDASLDIDPELLESLQRPTKRAKRNRKGEAVAPRSRRGAPANQPTVSHNEIADVVMKDDATMDEEDPTMPAQGPAFDFSLLQPGQTLSREQLLVMSTEDFDSYVQHLKNSRGLAEDEKGDFRTIRRRIRNRESARESRSNKKDYVDRLQTRVDTLKTHNKQLSIQIHGMQTENQALKEEVVYLQDMIKRTPALENLFNAFLYISTNSQSSTDSAPVLPLALPPTPHQQVSTGSSSSSILSQSSSSQGGPLNVNSFLESAE